MIEIVNAFMRKQPTVTAKARSAVAGVLAIVGSLFSACAWGLGDAPGGPRVNQLNLPVGVTKIASDIYDLHTLIMLICLVIFVLVFGVMFYAIIKHRKSLGHKAETWHENTTVEIIWTIVPFIIVIAMALPATRLIVDMKDTTNADLTIKATGYQWRWGYDYLNGEGEGIGFISTLATPREESGFPSEGIKANPKGDTYLLDVDNPLVVPVNKKVRVITTADDVIHAFAVPQFGIKQDAIPGFVRDTWFKAEKIGVYRGQCQELCGAEHAYMPIVVDVVSAEDYTKWVDGKKKEMAAQLDDPTKTYTVAELTTRGEKVFTTNCVVCHQAGGTGNASLGAPALVGDLKVLGPKDVQIAVLLHGQNNGKMPAWNQLSDVEIASVVTYTRNGWANSGKGADPVVQPADVTADRKK
jgi:cytochrome c oxidase subunit 2